MKREDSFNNAENNDPGQDNSCDRVTLTLDDGSEMLCDVIGIFDFNERDYICLLPIDDPDGDYILYRYSEDSEGEPVLDDMDDEEFEAVSEYFWEMTDVEDLDDFFEEDD